MTLLDAYKLRPYPTAFHNMTDKEIRRYIDVKTVNRQPAELAKLVLNERSNREY